jgi:hypothetical protein
MLEVMTVLERAVDRWSNIVLGGFGNPPIKTLSRSFIFPHKKWLRTEKLSSGNPKRKMNHLLNLPVGVVVRLVNLKTFVASAKALTVLCIEQWTNHPSKWLR